MSGEHPVVEGLRQTLAKSRSASAFTAELEGRIRQLTADMVDGRVLPRPEADALRASLLEFIRAEALVKLGHRNANDALRVLDKLEAYRLPQLESERPRLEAARAQRFPPPPPATGPELEALRSLAHRHPEACKISPGVENVYFAEELKDDGLPLPDALLALYAACDGFDLACLAAPHLPVFSLLPSNSIDLSDAEGEYPRRAGTFQGGDEVQLSIHCDRKKRWWLVYEREYEPIGRTSFDLPALLRLGLARMEAPTPEALNDELSWERFFGISDR